MSADVVTFGCRLNTYESEAMRGLANEAGLSEAVIVNTCAVTSEAVRQARQEIRRIKRERPDARILVSGCAAQTEPATFAAMPEVDRVLGNAEKLSATAWTDAKSALDASGRDKVAVGDIMAETRASARAIDGIEGRARAFVQVQNGCDHRCTFCIIPYGRGNSRSVATSAVVEQVRRLVERGYAEVVLTGVDITSYGKDLPGAPTLGRLAKDILTHTPELARLRLSSIDSVEVDADLIDAIATEPRLMPHLHLSLQAGDDLILKRMKRRHSRAEAIRFCHDMRDLRPDMKFGADFIAGFPTEDEDMFARTLDLAETCDLATLHVFPFSPRPGTPAARMPQLPREVVKERAARLRALGSRLFARHLDREVGARRRVLVEGETTARTETFLPVRLNAPAAPGALIEVAIAGHDGARLAAG